MKAGDRVWYWIRKKGERTQRRFGTIIQLEGPFARVRLDDTQHPVPVQTLEVKRLKREDEGTI